MHEHVAEEPKFQETKWSFVASYRHMDASLSPWKDTDNCTLLFQNFAQHHLFWCRYYNQQLSWQTEGFLSALPQLAIGMPAFSKFRITRVQGQKPFIPLKEGRQGQDRSKEMQT